jgi:spore germination protein KB
MMNKEIISDKQWLNLLLLFMFGNTFVMGPGAQAKNDMWLAILLAALFAAPVLMLYSAISGRYPGMDLFDILQAVFGKLPGKLLSLPFIWYSFHLGALVLRDMGEFMNTVGLPETPEIIPVIMFALICALGVKCGIEALSRCASCFIIGVFFLLILLTLLTIPNMKPERLLPVLYDGFRPLLSGSFEAFSFPFGELLVFTMVFDSIKYPKTISKIYLRALFIGGVILAFVAARNISVLGTETNTRVYFPAYTAIGRVNIGNFLQRLEISVSLIFLISGFIKISICLLAAVKGITKLLGFNDYRQLVVPISLLMVNLAYIMFDSIMDMFDFTIYIYPYYAFPFQVILPLIIFIIIEIKARLKKRDKAAQQSNSG